MKKSKLLYAIGVVHLENSRDEYISNIFDEPYESLPIKYISNNFEYFGAHDDINNAKTWRTFSGVSRHLEHMKGVYDQSIKASKYIIVECVDKWNEELDSKIQREIEFRDKKIFKIQEKINNTEKRLSLLSSNPKSNLFYLEKLKETNRKRQLEIQEVSYKSEIVIKSFLNKKV